MAAIACLRILVKVNADQRARLEALAPLINRLTRAFLESRWPWPRHFAALGDASFTLSDPRVDHLDGRELQALAEELQLKLFGDGCDGEVTLLLYEGKDGVGSFLDLSFELLSQSVRDGSKPAALAGSLKQITPRGQAELKAPSARTAEPASPRQTADHPHLKASYRGIYHTARRAFVGSVVTARPREGFGPSFSLVDGTEYLPLNTATTAFDEGCIEAGAHRLARGGFAGVMALPISFSSVVRRSGRDACREMLQKLPAVSRGQLAAVVYDVPRAPSFPALAQMQEVLGPHFGLIDLFAADPNFDVDSLPLGAVNFATLILPEAEDRVRQAAIRTFMRRRSAFKRRQVWPSITNVRTRVELGLCLQERVPLITGSIVCGPKEEAIAAAACGPMQLPYGAAPP